MKSLVGWLQKLESAKRPYKEGSRELREPGAPQLPPDRISAVLVTASLALICVTIAILIIADIAFSSATSGSRVASSSGRQQHLVGVQSDLLRLDDAPMRITSLPTQTAVITGLPGSPNRTPRASNPALRRFDTERRARERGIERQRSAVAQRLGSAPESKKQQLKVLTKYLGRYGAYLRDVRRHSKQL